MQLFIRNEITITLGVEEFRLILKGLQCQLSDRDIVPAEELGDKLFAARANLYEQFGKEAAKMKDSIESKTESKPGE